MAELSGKLDEDLQKLAEQTGEKLQASLKTASAILPVLFYLAVALVVAWRVIVFYRNYLNLTLSVG